MDLHFFSVHTILRNGRLVVCFGVNSQAIKKTKSDRENGVCEEFLSTQHSVGQESTK